MDTPQVTVDPNKQTVGAASAPAAPTTSAPVGEISLPPDSKGRVLVIEEPNVLAPYQLIRAIGGADAENGTYVNMILPLIYLAKINDEIIYQPKSPREIDALINRLGREGMQILLSGVTANFLKKPESQEFAKQTDDVALKK